MQTGKKYGMCLMNDSFTDLVKRKVVEPQEAYAKAMDKAGPPGPVQEERHRHVLGPRGAHAGAVPLGLTPTRPRRGRHRAGPGGAWSARGPRARGGRAADLSRPTRCTRSAAGPSTRRRRPGCARRRAARTAKPLPVIAADREQARGLCAAWPAAAERAGRPLLAGAAHRGPAGGARRARRGDRGTGTVAVRVPALAAGPAALPRPRARSSRPRPTARASRRR